MIPATKIRGFDRSLDTIEMPLISVLADMERTGVKLNQEDLKSITANLREDILSLEKEIYSLAGQNSIFLPQSSLEIFFLSG